MREERNQATFKAMQFLSLSAIIYKKFEAAGITHAVADAERRCRGRFLATTSPKASICGIVPDGRRCCEW
jgi:hypothetical protein